MKVGILGASGYVGGELMRLLLDHPEVELVQATSERYAGKYVTGPHPNLRGRTGLKFCRLEDVVPCDFVFAALPHGSFMTKLAGLRGVAPRIIDSSADFRLRSLEAYQRWYGHEHADPAALSEFVYGLVELHREGLRTATLATGAGCLATTAILGLAPIFDAGVVEDREVFIEAKVGSSAAGNRESPSSHHPERSGALRSFQPTGHRHTGEIEQELSRHGAPRVHFSATAVEAVRGVLVTAHVRLSEPLETKDLWRIYRSFYADEPFVRIVKESRGVFRYPEPKILIGSNYCDVGFEKDETGDRVVVLAALDNLMKGAAGNAVQAMNVMSGWDERTGLDFPGLHPV